MRILLAIAAVVFVSGCGTAPLNYDKVEEGNWKAKALIKDHEQNRSYIVNLNFNAIRGKKLRMDVSTAIGGAVAVLTADEKDVRYILVEAKKFYYGTARPEVMRPILSIPFDPRWLQNILFDTPFTEKSWSCEKDGKYLTKCSDTTTGVVVTWSQRVGDRKVVQIEHKRANVQINVLAFKPKVEDRKDLFELKAPPSFEKLNVH
jgi:hypothetical protein